MDTVGAIKNRILGLCGERNISINKLADICGLPPSSVKNIIYGKCFATVWKLRWLNFLTPTNLTIWSKRYADIQNRAVPISTALFFA